MWYVTFSWAILTFNHHHYYQKRVVTIQWASLSHAGEATILVCRKLGSIGGNNFSNLKCVQFQVPGAILGTRRPPGRPTAIKRVASGRLNTLQSSFFRLRKPTEDPNRSIT